MTATTPELQGESVVFAEVNYVRNAPPSGAPVLEFVTEAEDRSTMEVLPGERVPIVDTRGVATDLDREGFLPERTGVIVADRYDAAIVREAGTHAMTAAARKRCTLALARRAGRRLIGLTDPEATMLA